MNATDMTTTARIFLNYRREDSRHVTTRLRDDFKFAFGPDDVFLDTDRIVPGEPWPQTLRDRLNSAAVVIVIIGRDWLKVQDPDSFQRRLDAPGDWVRTEIEEALRQKKIVIPVLVRDAAMPSRAQLPASIADLVGLQSLTLSAEDWNHGVEHLLKALAVHGIQARRRDLANRPAREEPCIIGVLDYFYRRISQAARGERTPAGPPAPAVNCDGMSVLWKFIEDQTRQRQRKERVPFVRIQGQLSPYAPLLFGNPMHKRQFHLELRQRAELLIRQFGLEFGDLLNGLMSYSAGQLVIRPYFRTDYILLGLYESIVRNSIPIMISREYYEERLTSLFSLVNTIEVTVQGFVGEVPNFTLDAFKDFGITNRLRGILREETLQQVGRPNCALFVNGDAETFIDVPETSQDSPRASRYLDGDVWIANAGDSLITRFIDVSSERDMRSAWTQMSQELRASARGRGVVASFDVEIAPIDDTVPDRILSAEQLERLHPASVSGP